jgi:hypothetical protein
MKKISLKLGLVCMLSCTAMISYALTIPPKGGGGGHPGHTNAPFDGGASLLIAAGVAYGVKKARDSRKKAVQ